MKLVRTAALAAALVMFAAEAAHAAPVGSLKQHRLPTADSEPRGITAGSDGNFWFTESSALLSPKIGRITPAGDVTEFSVTCNFCTLVDIAQGPSATVYFTSNDPFLGRITTSGVELPPIPLPESDLLAASLAVQGDNVWLTDFNNNSLWRYDIPTGQFTQFVISTPSAIPYDVAVDSSGTVWFAGSGTSIIGRLDPTTGLITEIATPSPPRSVAIAADGQVWFTARFTPQAVGRVNPLNLMVTTFPLANVGPESIAAAPNGSMWFTQSTKGNIARIGNDGVVTEAKVVRNSGPHGITIDAQGDPWYTMMTANKVGEFQLN